MPIQHIATLRDTKSEEETLKMVETRGLPAWTPDKHFIVVGQGQSRVEGAEKVTGRAQYSYDIQLPGQLYARVLRSPYPHARIIAIDASKAEALPGVHAVLTMANTPDIDWYEEKCKLFDAAALILEEPVERLTVRDGKVVLKDSGKEATDNEGTNAESLTTSVTIAEVTKRMAPHMIQGHGAGEESHKDKSVRTFGAQCVEVEVDIETGEVTLLRLVASHDCGRIVNPTLVDSQIIGGITQGIGYALTEERILDSVRGIVLNANLEEYKVPTVADVPEITHARVNLPDLAANSIGVKGVGEPPLIPTAPAIANAIFDAIGVRLRHSPLNRRRILMALEEQRRANTTNRLISQKAGQHE